MGVGPLPSLVGRVAVLEDPCLSLGMAVVVAYFLGPEITVICGFVWGCLRIFWSRAVG